MECLVQEAAERSLFGALSAPVGSEDAIGHLGAILRAGDIETVWAHTCAFFRGLGFAGVLYGYSPDYRGERIGPPDDFLVLSTYGRDCTAELLKNRHYESSITFRWALRNVGIASFGMRAETSGITDFPGVRPDSLAFFDRFGMRVGLSIGFPPTRTRGRGVMSLISPEGVGQDSIDTLIAHQGETLFVVGAVAHRCLTSLPHGQSNNRLTRRQREVLEWLAEGKSLADIATIMGVALPTVEKHLRLAREALGVETTAHALFKAAYLNQVFMLAPDSGHFGPVGTTPPAT